MGAARERRIVRRLCGTAGPVPHFCLACGAARPTSSLGQPTNCSYAPPDMSGIKVGLIGGSGLGEAMREATASDGARHAIETPFGRPSDEIIETQWHGVSVFFL